MSVGRLLRRAGVSSRFHVLVLLAMAVFIVVVVHQVHNMDASSSSAAHTSHLERHLSASSDTDPEAAAAVAAPPGDTLVYYKKDIPLIWIGGVPRSGTTLMRAMLDAHRDVRCGEETRVIPRILGMHTGMQKSQVEMARLLEAHIDENVLNQALASYILSIIAQHGEAAPRLCNKDPFTLRSMTRLMKMFPQSKFILMIRDGRATAHSIISRHVTIKGFDIKSYRGAIKDWNRAISGMYSECSKHGPETCLPVHYEQLVLHPEREMRRILTFLDIAWDPMVIHHEQAIGKGISLSKKELSTDQVDKPINTKALTSWVDHIPEDVRRDMEVIAPMLRTLGYDPNAYPPNYGTPDKQVADNSARLAQDVGAAAGAVQPDPLPIHGGANYGPPDHKH